MKKVTVVFDVDGVLLNLMQTISGFIEKKYNVVSTMPFSPTQHSLRKRFDKNWIDSIGIDNIKNEFEKAGHWNLLDPMPQIDKIYEMVNNPLFDIHFINNIPENLVESRLNNLSALLGKQISSEKLICVPMGESKQPHIEKINPDYFIEDNLNILRDCHSSHKSIWINHQENVYDESCLKELPIEEVTTLNEALGYIQKQLYQNDSELLIKKIQSVLSDDLLAHKYKNVERQSHLEGHDYSTSEALFYLLGGKSSNLTLQSASFEKNGEAHTHWWIKSHDGQILDPTAEQFYAMGKEPPYEQGKKVDFLTKEPSKKTITIINRIIESAVELTNKVTQSRIRM
jgi:hypothetical protein